MEEEGRGGERKGRERRGGVASAGRTTFQKPTTALQRRLQKRRTAVLPLYG